MRYSPIFRRAIFVVGFLGAAIGSAETVPEVKALFERGNAAYAEGRYADALASYRQAYAEDALPKLLFNIARCEEMLGDHEGAFVDYGKYLASGANEKRAEIEAKRSELFAKVRVIVHVTSEPMGAQVFLDESTALVARTPADVRVPLGNHVLTLRATGYQAGIVHLEAQAGGRHHVDLVLTGQEGAPEGLLDVKSAPTGAVVSANALPVGTTPIRRSLPSGTYELTVEQTGHAPWRGKVIILPDGLSSVTVRLARTRSSFAELLTWGLGGGGALSLIAGGVFGVLAVESRKDFDDAPTKVNADRIASNAHLTDFFLAVGTAVLAGAVVIKSATHPEESLGKWKSLRLPAPIESSSRKAPYQ